MSLLIANGATLDIKALYIAIDYKAARACVCLLDHGVDAATLGQSTETELMALLNQGSSIRSERKQALQDVLLYDAAMPLELIDMIWDHYDAYVQHLQHIEAMRPVPRVRMIGHGWGL